MTSNPPQPQLLINEQLDTAWVCDFAGGSLVVLTRREPSKQTANEDAVAVVPVSQSAGVVAIADGCGGQANGQLASQLAIEALASAVQRATNLDNLRGPILDGIEAAISSVRQLGTGAATTLIAVEINAGILRTFHVGDSQALLVGGRGKIKLQTRSHSPVGYAVEAGILTEQAALEHEDRHLVSNVIGGENAHIDMGLPRKLDQRDTLIVGSDGLFDNLHTQEIVGLIHKGSLTRAAAAVAALVAERMATPQGQNPCKPDDLAFAIYRQHTRVKLPGDESSLSP